MLVESYTGIEKYRKEENHFGTTIGKIWEFRTCTVAQHLDLKK
jgi:hypothetical protein